MAVINASNLTLFDMARMKDPNGNIAHVVDMLSKDNPLLLDMVWKEGNLDTGELVTYDTNLPVPTWRKMNEGVNATKGTTGQFTETCGLLTGLSKVDTKLAELGGQAPAVRAMQDKKFMTAMNIEMEASIFYSSAKSAPEKMMGLSPRFDDLTTWPNQIISSTSGGAPSGQDQTSIWLIVWGDETVHGIFPKGTKAGFEVEDHGKQLVRDANSKEYFAWVTEFAWRAGIAVRDPRYVVRIANVDTSGLSTTGSAIMQDMASALEQVKDLNAGRPAFYCNRKVRKFLRLQALDSTKNSTLHIDSKVYNKPVVFFDEVPIHRTDSLLSTEAIVS